MNVDGNSDHQQASEPSTDGRPIAGARQDAGADVPSGEALLESPPAVRKIKKSRKQSLKGMKAVGKKSGKKAKQLLDARQLDLFKWHASLEVREDGGGDPASPSVCAGGGGSTLAETEDAASSNAVDAHGLNFAALP